uniref:BPTI/Kunitz inhibitor domain-containing protein n=1 Tax=Otus sunia TaxID=257818 RepID=A0A8C8ACC7_9STRI
MNFFFFFPEVPKLCRMEADGGPCRSHLRRYAFNLSSMRCEEFIYGGCYGNGNNFRDLQSCVDHCLPEKMLDKTVISG